MNEKKINENNLNNKNNQKNDKNNNKEINNPENTLKEIFENLNKLTIENKKLIQENKELYNDKNLSNKLISDLRQLLNRQEKVNNDKILSVIKTIYSKIIEIQTNTIKIVESLNTIKNNESFRSVSLSSVDSLNNLVSDVFKNLNLFITNPKNGDDFDPQFHDSLIQSDSKLPLGKIISTLNYGHYMVYSDKKINIKRALVETSRGNKVANKENNIKSNKKNKDKLN